MSIGDTDGIAVLTIRPEPTADERDAVVAALTVLALRRPLAAPEPVSGQTRWQRAARREALRPDPTNRETWSP